MRLPFVPRPKFKVCVIGDDKHAHECKEKGIPYLTADNLKAMNKNKKAVKKLGKKKREQEIVRHSLIIQLPATT